MRTDATSGEAAEGRGRHMGRTWRKGSILGAAVLLMNGLDGPHKGVELVQVASRPHDVHANGRKHNAQLRKSAFPS